MHKHSPTFGVVLDTEHWRGYRWFLQLRVHHFGGLFWWCFRGLIGGRRSLPNTDSKVLTICCNEKATPTFIIQY